MVGAAPGNNPQIAVRQNAELADEPAQQATGNDDQEADAQKQRPLMQKGMNNGGRKNARYHAADDRQGEAERHLRHKDARAPIFDEDAG
jgi:hypothetical protein